MEKQRKTNAASRVQHHLYLQKNTTPALHRSQRMRRQRVSQQHAAGLPIVEDDKERKGEGRTPLSNRRQQPLLFLIKSKWSVFGFKAVVLLTALSLSSSGLRRTKIRFGQHPRYIRFIVHDDAIGQSYQKLHVAKVSRLDLHMELYPSKRLVHMSRREQRRQLEVRDDSSEYRYGRADEFETDECKAQYDWQKVSYPTCNSLHEIDLLQIRDDPFHRTRLLGNGYWRDVWLIRDVVLKTIRYTHDFEDRNYDRHRRDALAMEHLTKSKMVVNIHGFCANSGISDYADGGSISDIIWPKRANATTATDLQKLQVATQAAMGLAATHNVDKEGVASIAHTDITPTQFVAVGGIFQLNDFNRARFIRWNITSNQPCKYYVGKNPGKNRSPEEYNRDLQTEKVDIYSFGNILYMLLTSMWPFLEETEEEAQEQVKQGLRPSIPEDTWNSTNPIVNDLKEVMFKCHEHDPTKRATAREVETLLLLSLHRHDPTALKRWGLEKEYGHRIAS
jgi:serine/threonine protein kinase